MKFEPFLALEASAGSGKTFALSVRYVVLILMGAKISEILAITFTKKAANEMKTRIVESFLNLEFKENELKEICEQLNKSKDEILALRDARKSEFLQSELKVRTFDSFFLDIVRSFSLNLGLMSDFEVNENKVEANAKFTQLLNEKELENLAKYILNTQSQSAFFENLEFLYENAYAASFENANFPENELKKANEIYQDFKHFALNLSENTTYQNNFSIENLDKDNIKEFATKKPIIKDFPKQQYFAKMLLNEEFLQKRENLLAALNAYANALERYKISHLMRYLSIFKEAKNFILKEQNYLSFGDVAKKANELLSQNALKDMIYFRLDGYIAHLLIDEFQDTSVLQYQILKPLIAEIVAGFGTREFKSFFYVGDKKQSIYRFRQGKKELFDVLRNDFKQIKTEILGTNYRSKKILVDFVNSQFSNFYADYKAQLSIKEGGFVSVLQIAADTKKDELFEENFKILSEQILLLKEKGAKEDEICILCWKNEDADDIVAEFERQKELGIRAFTQSNIVLNKKASVCVLLNYAKYCIFGDEFYKEVVKSLLNKDYEREKLNLNKNPAKILYDLAVKLNLNLADSALMQLFEYASKRENLLEILFNEPSEKLANDENSGVSVMTVHKSKGLEFEHIIVMDKLSKDQSDTNLLMLEYNTNKAKWELFYKDKVRENTRESAYTAFKEQREIYEQDDDLNKIYVAFTRAKSSLFIIKREKDSLFAEFSLPQNPLGVLEITNLDLSSEKKYEIENLEPFEKIHLQKNDKENSYENSPEIIFGNAFHNFLEQLNLKTLGNFEAVKRQITNKFYHLMDEDLLNELFLRVQNLLKNDDFMALLKNKTLLKEQNIAYKNERKTLDLLALSEDEAIIIDYKTGTSDEIEHEKQINLYKNAIEEILKKPKTRAFIVYALKDKINLKEIF